MIYYTPKQGYKMFQIHAIRLSVTFIYDLS